LAAVLVWALITFPAAHLGRFYFDPRVVQTAYHQLASAYLWTTVMTTLGCSLVGTAMLWLLPRNWTKLRPGIPTTVGLALGALLGYGAWRLGEPRFQAISAHFYGPANLRFSGLSTYPFSPANYLYSGLLAGAIVAELCRRSAICQSHVVLSQHDLKLNFHIAALMAWAVILKVLEWLDLTWVQPGSDAFGAHLFMLLAVLLWTPLACKFLWRYIPSRAFFAMFWTCVAGVLAPIVISYVLALPAILLVSSGLTPAYWMLWGGRFLDSAGLWKAIWCVVPGVTWGITVGWLRWRYLQLQNAGRAGRTAGG
jgi:hypothetical protein